jgi:hypothetical protein
MNAQGAAVHRLFGFAVKAPALRADFFFRFGFGFARLAAGLAIRTSESSNASRSHSVKGASTSSRCLIWKM